MKFIKSIFKALIITIIVIVVIVVAIVALIGKGVNDANKKAKDEGVPTAACKALHTGENIAAFLKKYPKPYADSTDTISGLGTTRHLQWSLKEQGLALAFCAVDTNGKGVIQSVDLTK